jgi:hypothetical protein
VRGEERDADARTDLELHVVEAERALEHGADLLRHGAGFLGRVQPAEEDAELVAAQPADGVHGSQDVADPGGDLGEDQVASIVT